MKRQFIVSDPGVLDGTPCIADPRVPARTRLDYVEASDSLADVLEGFPTVRRGQVIEFRETATERMTAAAH